MAIPNPPPLTYVLAASDPRAVNTAKGRPADQSVAVWVTTDPIWDELANVIALQQHATEMARQLLVGELVTLLVPVDPCRQPQWLAPAVRDGHALLFGARWAPLRDIFADAGVLYVSSANRTGSAPAETAEQIDHAFGSSVPVLELPDWQPGLRRRATTTVRIYDDGALKVTREGAQDHVFGGPSPYLDHLCRRYRARSTAIGGGRDRRASR